MENRINVMAGDRAPCQRNASGRMTGGLLAGLTVFLAALTASAATPDWPHWRGPSVTGYSADAKPPLRWSESEGIKWKVKIPGYGHSSPVVWRDRVYLQTAVPVDPNGDGGPLRYELLALDRTTGAFAWRKTACEEPPHEGHHADASYASSSPLIDGEHIIASFGSRGIFVFTMGGELVWSKDLGDMRTRRGFGEGASPAVHGETIVINWDHEGESFIVALDKKTGGERWRRTRDEKTTWATPLIIPYVEANGTPAEPARMQVIVPATNHVVSYDLSSGKTIWKCRGLGVNCIPTPVAYKDLVIVMSGYRDPALLAIRHAGASGDISGSDSIVWKLDGGTSYVPSPVLVNENLYFLDRSSPRLSCHDVRSGTSHFKRESLEDLIGIYGSPVAADGRIYLFDRGGRSLVLQDGKTLKILAKNELAEGCASSPALAGDAIFVRGYSHLYCISKMAP
ncbi:MAG: PQQ-binding-like beta-propeller repeat protein [Phycisphaerae bacterium]